VHAAITTLIRNKQQETLESSAFEPGRPVVVVSLVGRRSDLNGRRAIVQNFVSESGRFVVQVDGEQASIALKPDNLQAAPALGSTVILVSLETRSDLNGSMGIVHGFKCETGRFEVKVDGEKAILSLKPQNLREVVSSGSGARRGPTAEPTADQLRSYERLYETTCGQGQELYILTISDELVLAAQALRETKPKVAAVFFGRLGNSYLSVGQYVKAIEMLDQCSTIATEHYKTVHTSGTFARTHRSILKKHAPKQLESSLQEYMKVVDSSSFEEYCDEVSAIHISATRMLGSCYLHLGQCTKAIELYTLLLTLATKVGDRKQRSQTQALAYVGLGNCHKVLSQYDKAIEMHDQGLTIATELGDQQTRCQAMSGLGGCYLRLGNYTKAIGLHEQILTFSTEFDIDNRRRTQAAAYGNLGNCYSRLFQHDKAVEMHHNCLTMMTELGDRAAQAQTYANLGSCYANLGDLAKAIKLYEQCLKVATEVGDRVTEGAAKGFLAKCLLETYVTGTESEQRLEQSLAVATEVGDRTRQAVVLEDLGTYYDRLGQYDKAIELFHQSLTVLKEVGEGGRERGMEGGSDCTRQGWVYVRMGNCYMNLGQTVKAIEMHEQGLAVATEMGDRQLQCEVCGGLGSCYERLGETDTALDFYQQCLIMATEWGDRVVGRAASYIGSCCERLGDYDKAIEMHHQCLTIAIKCDDRSGHLCASFGLGNCYAHSGQVTQAIEVYKQLWPVVTDAGDLMAQARLCNNLGNALAKNDDTTDAARVLVHGILASQRVEKDVGAHDDRRVSLFEEQQSTYRLLQDVLVGQADRPDWALGVAEEAKARALAFRLGAGGGDAGGGGQDSTSHPLHILGKYMDIVRNSAWSDSEKTSTLTPLLQHEEDCKLLECFRGQGQWHGHDATANFTGIPDWKWVLGKLEELSTRIVCESWWVELNRLARGEGAETRVIEFSFLSDGKLAIWVVSGATGELLCSKVVASTGLGGSRGCSIQKVLEQARKSMGVRGRDAMREARDALRTSSAYTAEEPAERLDVWKSTDERASAVRGIVPEAELKVMELKKVQSAHEDLSRLVVEIEDLHVKMKEDVGGAIHDGVRCDACEMFPLVGYRYKCAVREDYDLCEKCYLCDKHGGERHTFFLQQHPGAAWRVAQRDLYSSVKDKSSLDSIVNGLMQKAHAESQREKLGKEHSLDSKDLKELDQELRGLIKKLSEVKELLRAQQELSKVMVEVRFWVEINFSKVDMKVKDKESLDMLLQGAFTCYEKSQDIGDDGKERLITEQLQEAAQGLLDKLSEVFLNFLYRVLIAPVEEHLKSAEELLIIPHKELFEVRFI
jgi:tetratricopeptide (TPR) repeat protein